MITLTRPQRNALLHMAEHGRITIGDGASIATLRVLSNYNLARIDIENARWVGHITSQGRHWLRNRAGNAAVRNADDVAADRRTQYRNRAAAYLTAAVTALERLHGGHYNTRRAVEELRNVPHPGRTPARMEAAGWWLYDNNPDGDVYHIARAVIEIAEACAYRAYPVDQMMLDRLADHETTLTEINTRLEIT
jgi:hypothetical protein